MRSARDATTSLGQLLSWSYRQLSQPAAQMFALLGVHCGPDITIPAAASLAGVPAADTRRAITELDDASLLTEHRPGRFTFHDLLRSYAIEQARAHDSEDGNPVAGKESTNDWPHELLFALSRSSREAR